MKQQEKKRVKRSQKDYTLAFKLSVVEQIEKGDMTYKQAQKLYGIQGRSTALQWLRKHGTLDWSKPKLHFMPSPKAKETPAQKIKRLEKELEDEKLKNLVLNETIDLLDNQHGTSIRKKHLPKQSANFKKNEE